MAAASTSQAGAIAFAQGATRADVPTGNTFDINSGATLSIADTAVTASAAQLNKLASLDAAAGAKVPQVYSATVARTDTTAKALFTLPANAIITGVVVYSAAASNAGTTATLSVGKSGTAGAYVNALDVKTAGTGAGTVVPNVAVLGTIGTSAVPVTGIYAESGGASSSGGPWTVNITGVV